MKYLFSYVCYCYTTKENGAGRAIAQYSARPNETDIEKMEEYLMHKMNADVTITGIYKLGEDET